MIFTLAADHGVATEGVSAYPQAVTAQMVENFARGGAAVNVLARHVGARVVVADLRRRRAARPTTRSSSAAVAAGDPQHHRGPGDEPRRGGSRDRRPGRRSSTEPRRTASATGEMGIGNTTAASALTAAITGADPAMVTGRGTGVTTTPGSRKVEAVRRALDVNRPDPGDGLGSLAKLGGFEIAGLVGVILAGAARRVPVVLDGFIAGAAALVAVALAPAAPDYVVASHRSAEPGHALALEALGLEPYLDLGMRLGEGTGAALGIGLVRAALACCERDGDLQGRRRVGAAR